MARKTILSGATAVPTVGAERVLHGPVCARARVYPPILREGQAAPVGKVSRVGRVQELLARDCPSKTVAYGKRPAMRSRSANTRYRRSACRRASAAEKK